MDPLPLPGSAVRSVQYFTLHRPFRIHLANLVRYSDLIGLTKRSCDSCNIRRFTS